MGFSNGTSKADKTVQRGQKGEQRGERGIFFNLFINNYTTYRNEQYTIYTTYNIFTQNGKKKTTYKGLSK